MRKSTRIISLMLLSGLFLSFSTAAGNQSGKKQHQDPLQHDVTVILKLVQVSVLDKEGNPVTDLKKEDFELYDNGRIKTITDFEVYMTSEIRNRTETRLVETEPGKPRDVLNRKLFFLFDLNRIGLSGFGRSKEAALHFLKTKIQPTDEIAVFTFNYLGGLKVREYLTRDHGRIIESIKNIRDIIGAPSRSGPTLASITREAEQAAAGETGRISGNDDAGGVQTGGLTIATPDPADISTQGKAFDFLVIMTEMAKAMRYIPGNKSIIWFSNGFPRVMYEQDLIFRETFEDMAEELSNSNSSIHSINTLGALSKTRPAGARGDMVMQRLADLTGGRYFEDVQYYEKIADGLHNITGNYYVLGYYIDEQWDGRFNQIEVKVKRDDCRVIAQKGYYHPKPFTKFTKLEKELNLIDLALNEIPQFQSPHPLAMTALPYAKSGANLVMLAEVLPDNLPDIFKKGDDTELTTMILDENNTAVSSSSGKIDLQKNISEESRKFFYRIAALPPGDYRCRMILRNLSTGRAAVGRADISLPDLTAEAGGVFQPLILIPEQAASYIKISRDQEKFGINQTPSLNQIYPYLTTAHSPLIKEIEPGITYLLAVMRGEAVFSEEKMEVTLFHPVSKEREILDFTILAKSMNEGEEYKTVFFEIELPELDPGDYILNIAVSDSPQQQEKILSQTLSVMKKSN